MSLLGCRFHCRRVTPKAPSLCLGNRRHSGGGCSIGLGLGGEGEKRPVSPVRDTYCEQESRLCCFKPAADKGFCFVCLFSKRPDSKYFRICGMYPHHIFFFFLNSSLKIKKKVFLPRGPYQNRPPWAVVFSPILSHRYFETVCYCGLP